MGFWSELLIYRGENLEPLYALIRRFEGCRLQPYLCPAGVWTCGWGSTGADVFPGKAWTQEYADARMHADAQRVARAARRLCPGVSGNVLCAVADFAYNCGTAALERSTFRRKLNAGDVDAAKLELRKWVYAGGRKLRGLILRREAEAALIS